MFFAVHCLLRGRRGENTAFVDASERFPLLIFILDSGNMLFQGLFKWLHYHATYLFHLKRFWYASYLKKIINRAHFFIA